MEKTNWRGQRGPVLESGHPKGHNLLLIVNYKTMEEVGEARRVIVNYKTMEEVVEVRRLENG